MALITRQRLRTRANVKTLYKSLGTVLAEDASVQSRRNSFDIFLSHSMEDAEIVLGAKSELEDKGYSVYVDWIVDKQLDRRNVSYENADILRVRMRQSRCLVYLHTISSTNSVWMPWELGYVDGLKGLVTILPVTVSDTDSYKGTEYLGLYPYIDTINGSFFVNSPVKGWCTFDEWIKKQKSIQ